MFHAWMEINIYSVVLLKDLVDEYVYRYSCSCSEDSWAAA